MISILVLAIKQPIYYNSGRCPIGGNTYSPIQPLGGVKMGKKKDSDFVDQVMNFFNTEHTKNARKSTHDKHTGANRNQGSGKPNSKSSVRERRRRNGG